MDRRDEQYWLRQMGVEDVPEEVVWDTEWLENVAQDNQEAENEGDLTLYPDPRWGLLNDRLQALILVRFGGDVDEALFFADRMCHERNKPPAWAAELHVMHMRKLGKVCNCMLRTTP